MGHISAGNNNDKKRKRIKSNQIFQLKWHITHMIVGVLNSLDFVQCLFKSIQKLFELYVWAVLFVGNVTFARIVA